MKITQKNNTPYTRKSLFLLVGLAVGATSTYFYQHRTSQPSKVLPFYSPRKNITKKTILYAVSGNGLEHESYMQGLFHVEHKDYDFSPQMKKAIAKTDLLVTEIDFSLQKAFLTAAKDIILKIGSDYGLKPKQIAILFAYMRDGKAVGLAVPAFTINAHGEIQSPEERLYNLFQEQGKRTQALETIEEQMGLSAIKDPDSRELIMVFSYLSNILKHLASVEKDKNDRAYYEKLWHMYLTGEALPKALQIRWNSEIEEIYAEVLARRNKLWIPRMQKIMHEQPTYFAVGRWHFFGPQGLLKLLLEAGYTVEKIESNGKRSAVTTENYDAPFLAD